MESGDQGLFIGIGTVVNVAAVLVGSVLGVLIGHRLSLRTRDLVTDALGLVTLLIAISRPGRWGGLSIRQHSPWATRC
ncbi:DUF554 family protein [Kribbella catacumbae]|uniref:DUF554 family protein n=1 Tax=Kribbella catacumbae TaxID=460086 RepID=UPI002351D2AB|nr:DUF554 family protein [Kribbella catacumbae]